MTQSEFLVEYDRLAPAIFRFIYHKTWHRETAEDIASHTWLKALEAADNFDPRRGTFSSWIFQIARRTVIDHWRRTRSTTDIDDMWDLGEETDFAADIDARTKLDQVKKEMQNLTSEQREIVVMRVWDGLSHAEIAHILGKSEASCKMAFSRAVTKLRHALPLLILLSPIFHSPS